MYGFFCDRNCNNYCRNGCEKILGFCNECVSGKMGNFCNMICGDDCVYGCNWIIGNCIEWFEWYDDRLLGMILIYFYIFIEVCLFYKFKCVYLKF